MRQLAKDYDWDYGYLIALEKKKLQRECYALDVDSVSCRGERLWNAHPILALGGGEFFDGVAEHGAGHFVSGHISGMNP